jgi:antibiotic biosynthesis monooxygenase (ABM) superfamily enzyme
MATVTGLAIYPLSLIVNNIYTFLGLPAEPYIRGLIVTICLVGLMTYIVMPKMTSIFRGWLFTKK